MKVPETFDGMTRAEVVPYYVDWILTRNHDQDFWPMINKKIIDRWSNKGLIYIKEEAWKAVNVIKNLSDNGYHITK